MRKFFVLYCFEENEIAKQVVPKFHSSINPCEGMYISLSKETVKIEKVVWLHEDDVVLYCCGILLGSQSGPHEGGSVMFPFGKIPRELWTQERLEDWNVQKASPIWSQIISTFTMND